MVDTTPPVITLVGLSPEAVEGGTFYFDAGATASDNVDGDITASIVTMSSVNTEVLGSYTVIYDVADAWGNNALQVVRTVNVVDTTPPVITLLGSDPDPVLVAFGGIYNDARASAFDTVDGDITASIVTDNPVDTKTPGKYLVTYDVTDSSGNPALQVTRTVIVVTEQV